MFELRSENEQEVERGEHSRQREQHDEGPGEGGSPETEGLCSWLLAGDYLAMRCPLEALTTWPLASSEPARESLWVILYTTRRLSYFNLLHLTGVNLHLQFMLGF